MIFCFVPAPANRNDGDAFRADVRRIWDEFQRIEKSRDVFRLVSERIVSDAVRAEERGGYLWNRVQRLILGLGRRHAELGAFRGWLDSRLFRLYSLPPEHDGFDFDGYLAALDSVRSKQELHDRDSFGLVAVLRKTGGVSKDR